MGWKYLITCVAFFFGAINVAGAQQLTRYVIQFKNKATSPFSLANPSQYLSARSIARRTRYSIPLDSTDLPVTPRYLDSLRNTGDVTILNVSKWLNQVSIKTTDAAALQKINSFSFVISAQPIAARIGTIDTSVKMKSSIDNADNQRTTGILANYFDYGTSFPQVHLHNGEFLHNIGLRGQNMVIGMLDAGYAAYTTLKVFDSARTNNQIIETWDFVAREQSVAEDDAHGTACFSTIAANLPGQFVGTAPKAFFLLYRSEEAATEYPIEEHNWVCAAERVDSAGGDVISSSLGYTTFDNPTFNHTYANLNGNTTTAAIGADLAAKKGLLVVNAAGNDGANTWHYISTPADGDSVLAVGAVNAAGQVASFSSYGPSSDGQVKPDVASFGVGTIVAFTNNSFGGGNGTSFACPNLAGLATCLWQGFPEYNNIKILNALRQAGSIYTTPNDRIGYGIPDVKKAVISLLKEYATSTATISNCKTNLEWKSKDVATMRYDIERKAPGEITFKKIGEQAGTGLLFGIRSYQFRDSLAQQTGGPVSYRIRQVIDTASATFTADYIDTVTVTLNTSCPLTSVEPANNIQLLPSPASKEVFVSIKNSRAIPVLTMNVISSNGQLVSKHHFTKQAAAAIFAIPITTLASGQYHVLIYDGGKLLATREFVKL